MSQSLPADSYGQVYIVTSAGLRAMIDAQAVCCEAQFTCSPDVDGQPANGVRAGADGTLAWVLGNLGNIPVVDLTPGTYDALGWNITVTDDGSLRATSTGTGRSVAIATDDVTFLS